MGREGKGCVRVEVLRVRGVGSGVRVKGVWLGREG